MMMKRLRYFGIIVLIAIGIGIILNPWYKALRFDMMQRSLMKAWYGADASGEIPTDASAPSFSGNNWSSSTAVIGGGALDNEIWEENTVPVFDQEYVKNNMEGIITIDAIKLRSPILNKVTNYNLNIGICSVVEKNHMGESGNYVLSGHNSRIYGRHFNRLKELGIGDIVILDNGTEQFEYTVTDVFIVSPEDVWVMNDDGERNILTLITCYYGVSPTGRLIVKAEMSS